MRLYLSYHLIKVPWYMYVYCVVFTYTYGQTWGSELSYTGSDFTWYKLQKIRNISGKKYLSILDRHNNITLTTKLCGYYRNASIFWGNICYFSNAQVLCSYGWDPDSGSSSFLLTTYTNTFLSFIFKFCSPDQRLKPNAGPTTSL